MEEDLQPRRDEVFSISSPALRCLSAFGADDADEAYDAGARNFPEQYFIASYEEGEPDCAAGDGPA
eukprot:3866634-Alexandrium_andersonii.AAC.1